MISHISLARSRVNARCEEGEVDMRTLKTTIEFWREGGVYLARSPELDMVAQGDSLEEAKGNRLEVAAIQFDEMKELGTLDEFLLEAGYKFKDETVESEKEIIGFDKSFITLAHVV